MAYFRLCLLETQVQCHKPVHNHHSTLDTAHIAQTVQTAHCIILYCTSLCCIIIGCISSAKRVDLKWWLNQRGANYLIQLEVDDVDMSRIESYFDFLVSVKPAIYRVRPRSRFSEKCSAKKLVTANLNQRSWAIFYVWRTTTKHYSSR